MKTARFISILIGFAIILTVFSLPAVTLAQDEEPPATDNATQTAPTPEPISAEPPQIEPIAEEEEEQEPDSVTVTAEFPEIEAIATGTFEYGVKLEYKGQEDRVFDLNTILPAGWSAYINPQYDSKMIPSIAVEASPFIAVAKNLKVTVTPPTWPLADPAEYTVTLEALSGDVIGKLDLTAKVTAKYILNAAPANELYNTRAKAGQDNTYSIKVANIGTAVIENITFSTDKPDGWEITFQPKKIDALESFDTNTVDINIKPPPKTVSGDYMFFLRITGKQGDPVKMDVRVTVETPTIWGWVGVAIIAVVIIGLIVIFMRFGRR